MLQSNRRKFNKNNINPTCLLFKESNETLEHFLLGCSATEPVRKPILKDITTELEHTSDIDYTNTETSRKLQIQLDCTILMDSSPKNGPFQLLSSIQYQNRRLMHNLYLIRCNKQQELKK